MKYQVVRSEVDAIRDSNRIQFSIATLLRAIALTSIVLAGIFHWHRWALWSKTPFGDPSEPWFIESRQQMFNWTTPCIAAFVLVAAFAIWYSVANRNNFESLVGGLCLAFPILLPLVPAAMFISLVFPFFTPLAGCWLLYKRRVFLGAFVILFAIAWLYFAIRYFDEWFEVYGD